MKIQMDLSSLSQTYERDHYMGGVPILIPEAMARHRASMEAAEKKIGSLHLQGQTVWGIDQDKAILYPLQPREASFQQGRTPHASIPNRSNNRRIGLNVQYIASHVKQTKHDRDTVMLVRRDDWHNHYGYDRPAEADLEPAALEHQCYFEDLHRETAGAS